ncbi:macrophage mannose receptor 1-like [Paralichthys olivaceus]|uniref:macrophage mannose receptor 1-like n=1 Tax=Paralichthys olivaceus TaxID=8255 RepID=UPI003750C97C
MSKYLVILLLTSGSVTLGSHIHREYHPINESKTWDEAQSYCRENYNDLATIDNHDDIERLENMVSASNLRNEMWIGLRETGPESWVWSVGETGMSQESPTYSNWDSYSHSHSDHYCGGMGTDGKWISGLCGTALPFVCQGVEASGEVSVVLQNKTWQQAQQHCRRNNMELASARSQSENQALQQVLSETGSPALVWIGLVRDKWKWSDQSNSSFRYWHHTQPNNDGDCTLFTINGWYDRGCQYKTHFICHIAKRRQKVKQFVKLEIKSDSLLNYQDFAVSEAILIQIQKQNRGVKFQWIIQPDGKILHKKTKEKVNDGSGNN